MTKCISIKTSFMCLSPPPPSLLSLSSPLSFSLCLPLSVSLSLFLSFSLPLSFYLSFSLFLWLSLSLPPPFYLPLSLSVTSVCEVSCQNMSTLPLLKKMTISTSNSVCCTELLRNLYSVCDSWDGTLEQSDSWSTPLPFLQTCHKNSRSRTGRTKWKWPLFPWQLSTRICQPTPTSLSEGCTYA